MIVRRLGSEDLEIFRDLRLTSLKTDPDSFASDHDVWAAYSDPKWLSYLEGEQVFGAFVDGVPAGLIGLIPNTKSRLRHRNEIAMVYVAAEFRGTGVANSMLEHVIQFSRAVGILQIELSVNATNARAVDLYARHGFRTYGRLPQAFRTGDGFCDDLLMVLQLN
ncbi:MAG: GNAT family N-acetyltransferase [Boseongicola sp.]